ncbi:MAG: hypothetical protein ABI663_03115 [Chryseolinea sp.]
MTEVKCAFTLRQKIVCISERISSVTHYSFFENGHERPFSKKLLHVEPHRTGDGSMWFNTLIRAMHDLHLAQIALARNIRTLY